MLTLTFWFFLLLGCRPYALSSKLSDQTITAVLQGYGLVSLDFIGEGETGTVYRIVGTDQVLKRSGASAAQKSLFAAEEKLWTLPKAQEILGDHLVPGKLGQLIAFDGSEVNERVILKDFLEGPTYSKLSAEKRVALQEQLGSIFDKLKKLSKDHDIHVTDLHDDNLMITEKNGRSQAMIVDGAVSTVEGQHEHFMSECASYQWCSNYVTSKSKCQKTALMDLFAGW